MYYQNNKILTEDCILITCFMNNIIQKSYHQAYTKLIHFFDFIN